MSIEASNSLEELDRNYSNYHSQFSNNIESQFFLPLHHLLPKNGVTVRQVQAENFSPLMAKVSVKHKGKNGEENEVTIEVDTRKPQKPKFSGIFF